MVKPVHAGGAALTEPGFAVSLPHDTTQTHTTQLTHPQHSTTHAQHDTHTHTRATCISVLLPRGLARALQLPLPTAHTAVYQKADSMGSHSHPPPVARPASPAAGAVYQRVGALSLGSHGCNRPSQPQEPGTNGWAGRRQNTHFRASPPAPGCVCVCVCCNYPEQALARSYPISAPCLCSGRAGASRGRGRGDRPCGR